MRKLMIIVSGFLWVRLAPFTVRRCGSLPILRYSANVYCYCL